MVFGKGSTKKSNLDRFLHCTTPVVPPQSLPKVCETFLSVSFFLPSLNLMISWIVNFKDPFFFFLVGFQFCICRRRLGVWIGFGINRREKRLSFSDWVICGIATMNGALMELVFQFISPVENLLFNIMFRISLLSRFSPLALPWSA